MKGINQNAQLITPESALGQLYCRVFVGGRAWESTRRFGISNKGVSSESGTPQQRKSRRFGPSFECEWFALMNA